MKRPLKQPLVKRIRKVRHPNADDLRKLKYRIGEVEREFQEGVKKLYECVIVQGNTVFIGLPAAIEGLHTTLIYLAGLRRAAECMEGRAGF